MATAKDVAVSDERYAICIDCREKKWLAFNDRYDTEPSAPSQFSPSQARCLPFERRCIECHSKHRLLLASYSLRRVRSPRLHPLWAVAEDGALHGVIECLQAATQRLQKHAEGQPTQAAVLKEAGDFDGARGYTALHCALMSSADVYKSGLIIDGRTIKGDVFRYEVACVLMEAGMDADAASLLAKFRPLHLAAATGDRRLVDAVLAHGAKAHRVDSQGRNALHYARGTEVCHILIREGLSTSYRDKNGNTPLMVALEEDDDPERIALLERLAERKRYGAEVMASQAKAMEDERRRLLDEKRAVRLELKAKDTLADKAMRMKAQYEAWRKNEELVTEAPPVTRTDQHYEKVMANIRAKKAAAEQAAKAAQEQEKRDKDGAGGGGSAAGSVAGSVDGRSDRGGHGAAGAGLGQYAPGMRRPGPAPIRDDYYSTASGSGVAIGSSLGGGSTPRGPGLSTGSGLGSPRSAAAGTAAPVLSPMAQMRAAALAAEKSILDATTRQQKMTRRKG